METLEIIKLVLLALFIGAFVPVLLQVRETLKSLDRKLDGIVLRANKSMDEVTESVHQANKVLASLNQSGSINTLVKAAGDVGSVARQLEGTVKMAAAIGAAVAPSVAAAIQAWRMPPAVEEEQEATHVDQGSNGSSKKTGDKHANI